MSREERRINLYENFCYSPLAHQPWVGSAVDRNIGAMYKGGPLRGEKHDQISNFLGLAYPTERGHTFHSFLGTAISRMKG